MTKILLYWKVSLNWTILKKKSISNLIYFFRKRIDNKNLYSFRTKHSFDHITRLFSNDSIYNYPYTLVEIKYVKLEEISYSTLCLLFRTFVRIVVSSKATELKDWKEIFLSEIAASLVRNQTNEENAAFILQSLSTNIEERNEKKNDNVKNDNTNNKSNNNKSNNFPDPKNNFYTSSISGKPGIIFEDFISYN